jgi:hypothetical protein
MSVWAWACDVEVARHGNGMLILMDMGMGCRD